MIELTDIRKRQIRNDFTRLSKELGDTAAVAYIAGRLSGASEFKSLTVREKITVIQGTVGMAIRVAQQR